MDPVQTELSDRIKERMITWRDIRPKGAYSLDELNIFKSVNELISKYNAVTGERKIDPIMMSYTPRQLSEIIEKLNPYDTKEPQ